MRVLCLLLLSAPMVAFPMSIRVNVDVNIIHGDGHINDGDKNESEDNRDNSGSNHEDNSDRSRETHND